MKQIKFPITSIAETSILLSLGIFGNKISEFIKLKAIFLIIAFAVLFFAYFILKLFLQEPATNVVHTDTSGLSETPQKFRLRELIYKFRSVFFTGKIIFSFGIIMGLSVAIIFLKFLPGEPFIISLLWGSIHNPMLIVPISVLLTMYEIIALMTCFAIISLMVLKLKDRFSIYLPLGLALGLSCGILVLDPANNDLLFTLLGNTIILVSFGKLLQGSKSILLYALIVSLFLFSFYFGSVAHILNNSLPAKQLTEEGGNLEFFSSGIHRVYYKKTFHKPPSLELHLSNYDPSRVITKFKIVEQEVNYFDVEIIATEFPVHIVYVAAQEKKHEDN